MKYVTTLLLLLLIPSIALAEFRVATVDIAQILNETSESKDAREKLNEQSQKAKAKVEKRRKELQEMESDLKDKDVALDSKEAEDFRKEAKEFRRFVKDTEDTLKREFLRSNTKVTKEALDAIKAYAKANKIDLVLDKGSAGRSAVIFGAASVDITNAVIKKLKG